MNDKNTYSVDKYLEIIAEKEGITKEEVQQEIGRAVSIASCSFHCVNDNFTDTNIAINNKFEKP